jgi:hypothetical protein
MISGLFAAQNFRSMFPPLAEIGPWHRVLELFGK